MNVHMIIDWNDAEGRFSYRGSDGGYVLVETAEQAVLGALEPGRKVLVNERMPANKLIEVTAAAIFIRASVFTMDGKELTGTPVPDAKVSYITRKELGAVLPEGWYIECQLNRYAACWGDAMTFPARAHLASAIADINVFLAMSIKQANDDLLASLQAQTDLAEMEQVPMWLSSDSA